MTYRKNETFSGISLKSILGSLVHENDNLLKNATHRLCRLKEGHVKNTTAIT